jgi:NAD(P)-dependent dehydrogenase (short-subunit alcohol dehydrogenase family)
MDNSQNDMSINELFSVQDKVVLISGAGGLGQYLAKGFAQNGAKVIITNTSQSKADSLCAALNLSKAFAMDQTKRADIDAVTTNIVKEYGRIDVLINTAAICTNDTAEQFDENDLRRIIDVNMTSAMLLSQAVGKAMIAQNSGKIIHIGSIAGLMCHSPISMPYEATKGAIHQLTRTLATVWAPYHINVNCIAPTWIYTPMTDDVENEQLQTIIDQHPIGRISTVHDHLGPALFLASAASDYVSGHILYVDGAWSVAKPW